MDTTSQVIFIGYIIFCFFIGDWLGKKRRIGSAWSIFFCITFAIIFALPIIFLSPKKIDKGSREPYKKWVIIIGFVVFLLGINNSAKYINDIYNNYFQNFDEEMLREFLFSIGITGLGAYIAKSIFIKNDKNESKQYQKKDVNT